ncbi:MAG TPA: Uma2 family endonuclease [Bryobacteraceae bacterium]|nr:Uma2 family endonuclease [Bryobacteraceae bacterium]
MATTTVLTWDEFLRLPDQPGKQELVKGELIELPPAKDRHNTLGHRIFFCLHTALEQAHAHGEASGLGEVRMEAGYRLGGQTCLQPDVSVTHAGQRIQDYLQGSPAIAIEVVSPGNTPRALAAKTALYFEYGALEVWHFYPEEGHAVVQIAGAEPATVRDFVTTPLLPGFALHVQEILRG